MTYVVTENCIKCKYTDCVSVCPVDCFKVGENMLVIDPDECIDCGVCEPECPAGAISPESEQNITWQEINRKYAKLWPTITEKIDEMSDAEKHLDEPDKYRKYFSAKPGKGYGG